MPLPSAIRLRRSAAQLLAVARVAREIRAADGHGRRKYIRDFAQAFPSYQSVLTAAQMESLLRGAGVLLVGDYHSLPASQRFAAGLIERLAAMGRPVVVGLEMIFSRDQPVLDEWLRGEIDEQELHERLRYGLDWGYDWQPVRDVLLSARRHGQAVYGLDCRPRDDLRRIAARDRHAAAKIGEMRQRHPDAALLVLFGESHLAPNHLPELLRKRLPGERLLTVLQNVDPLYWQASGERRERVEAVRVRDDVVCVFTATPLEKYESYRMWLEHWRQQRASALDAGPTIDNLIDALLGFLHVEKYSPRNGRQPRFLVDLLPAVYSRPDCELLLRLLERKNAAQAERTRVLATMEEQGSCYVPRLNAIFVRRFHMAHAAEEAARFVHHACRGLLKTEPAECGEERAPEDTFYARVLEDALAYFGSRVLCPSRPAARESGLYALYAQPREAIEGRTIYSYADYMRLIDFIILHKDFEANVRRYYRVPALVQEGVRYGGEKFAYATRQLGYMLGSELYDAYVAGRITRRYARSLFFRDLAAAGGARAAYFSAVQRARGARPRRLAA